MKPVNTNAVEVPLDPEDLANSRRSRWLVAKGLPVYLLLLVLAGALVIPQLVNRNHVSSNPVAETGPNTAEVALANLEEIATLDGTLGREAGSPVVSLITGTATWLPESGEVISQGDVLFEMDNKPVVLMRGSLPAYRDITLTEDTVEVVARSSGIITWLPEEGAIISEGEVLFVINGEPAVLLYGETPAYRTMQDLSTNMIGDDVLQLEEALVALGHATTNQMTVDGEFTNATETAVEVFQETVGGNEDGVVQLGEVIFLPGPVEVNEVVVEVGDLANEGMEMLVGVGSTPLEGEDVYQLERALVALGYDTDGGVVVDGTMSAATISAMLAWQAAIGMETDGVVNLGEVIFLESDPRIADLAVPLGGNVSSGSAVLQITGSDIVVTALLPAADQELVSVGDAVTVELPDDSRTLGTVTEIATVAVSVQSQTMFEVTVLLDDPAVASGLDEAPVKVEIVTDSVRNVLAVPVTALLALREGGYGVEVDLGDGTTMLVAVDPGLFAGGLVEVKSDELQLGMRVIVP